MAGQLVGPREAPATPGPLAGERLLARVPSQVRLEVRALGVHFGAAWIRAAEYLVFFGHGCGGGGGGGSSATAVPPGTRWGRVAVQEDARLGLAATGRSSSPWLLLLLRPALRRPAPGRRQRHGRGTGGHHGGTRGRVILAKARHEGLETHTEHHEVVEAVGGEFLAPVHFEATLGHGRRRRRDGGILVAGVWAEARRSPLRFGAPGRLDTRLMAQHRVVGVGKDAELGKLHAGLGAHLVGDQAAVAGEQGVQVRAQGVQGEVL